MNKIKDVIFYILKNYPNKEHLSNARLTKMVYLSDWKQAIENKKQITDINWYFDNYGPYVSSVIDTVLENDNLFEYKRTKNLYGNDKSLIILKNENYNHNIFDDEIKSINHIINITKNLNWSEFIRLVYSTYPIITSERYSNLDLVKKAEEYATS